MHGTQKTSLLRMPNWWHPHGIHMQVVSITTRPKGPALVIQSTDESAALTISHALGVEKTWRLQWRLYSHPYQQVNGSAMLSPEELCLAFALKELPINADPVVQRFCTWICRPGIFFRLGDFLNIPCRGTGKDGDPNISLFLTPEIKVHLTNLIAL